MRPNHEVPGYSLLHSLDFSLSKMRNQRIQKNTLPDMFKDNTLAVLCSGQCNRSWKEAGEKGLKVLAVI